MRFNLNWKPHKVFYGWWIIAACFLIALYTGGVIFYGFTAIFEPLINEFDWSYTQVSFAASLRGLEMGLLAPVVGILTDRWGPRRLIFAGAIITGLGLLLLSQTSSIGMLYGAFILVALGMSASSATVLTTAVANWFHKKISLASGIMICGYGFSGLLVPLIVNLIDSYGWRMSIDILAIGMFVICLPLSLVMRHKPEQYGYLPDGEVKDVSTQENDTGMKQVLEVNAKPVQALKSGFFWHIALALACQSMALSAVITHVMPFLGSVGFSRTTSALIASGIPLVSIAGRLGIGALGDRHDKIWVTAGCFALMSLGLLCFGFLSFTNSWLLIPFLILFSIGYGGNNTMRVSLLRETFGRQHFGSIHGFTIGIMMLGTIAGPPLAGYIFDTRGSYQLIWFIFSGLAVAALTIIITTPKNSTQTI